MAEHGNQTGSPLPVSGQPGADVMMTNQYQHQCQPQALAQPQMQQQGYQGMPTAPVEVMSRQPLMQQQGYGMVGAPVEVRGRQPMQQQAGFYPIQQKPNFGNHLMRLEDTYQQCCNPYKLWMDFYDHFVVMHEQHERQCCPGSYRTTVIPKYQLTGVTFYSGSTSTCCTRTSTLLMFLLALMFCFLAILGFSGNSLTGYDCGGYYYSCSPTPPPAVWSVLFLVFLIAYVVLATRPCWNPKHIIDFNLSVDREASSKRRWCRPPRDQARDHLVVQLARQQQEQSDFISDYVYGHLGKGGSMGAYHTAALLLEAGIIDPVRPSNVSAVKAE